MQRKTRELMLLAAWRIEKEAADIRECCTVDGIAWDEEEDQREYEQAMSIVRALRREAGVTEPAEPEPEVITPIGPEAEWYDPAKHAPEPLHSVLVIWSSAGVDPIIDMAYRLHDGRWVLDGGDQLFIEPLAWTPLPQMPKWLEDK